MRAAAVSGRSIVFVVEFRAATAAAPSWPSSTAASDRVGWAAPSGTEARGRRGAVERLTRDGVALAYTEGGSGAPPLLLVHGWCGDHAHLVRQFEHFGRTHRV